MKPGLIGDPNIYLGAKVKQVDIQGDNPNEKFTAWGLLPAMYIIATINKVETYLAKDGQKIPKKHATGCTFCE